MYIVIVIGVHEIYMYVNYGWHSNSICSLFFKLGLNIGVIENNYGQDCILFSREVWDALKILRDFNLNDIYKNPSVKRQSDKIKRMYDFLLC